MNSCSWTPMPVPTRPVRAKDGQAWPLPGPAESGGRREAATSWRRCAACRCAGDRGQIHAGRRDAPHRRILVLDHEIGVPAQLFDALRQPDVLVVDVGVALAWRGVAADAVPQSKLEPTHL